MRSMKKKEKIVFTIISLFTFIAVIYVCNYYGISENKLIKDASKRHSIDETWEHTMSKDGTVAALLFYDDEQKQSNYAIYRKKDGISIGYFYSKGGTNRYINDGILEISYMDSFTVLLSLNQMKISKIVTDQQIFELDPAKPFTVIIPKNAETIELYNKEGASVPIDSVECH